VFESGDQSKQKVHVAAGIDGTLIIIYFNPTQVPGETRSMAVAGFALSFERASDWSDR
jgi:hypothetical protein